MLENKKIILGTVQFGLDYGINNKEGKPSYSEVESILKLAYLNGITRLDSAEAYGDSHEVIGRFHRDNPYIKFSVSTKFFPGRKDLGTDIIKRIRTNIDVLNVSFLESYMFHSFKDYLLFFESNKKGLHSMLSEGKIKKIGVSVHSNEEIEELLKNDSIKLIQLPYNLLDNRTNREDVFKKAKEKGVEINTRSAFLQGLLFRKREHLTGNVKGLSKELTFVQDLCDTEKISMAGLAINYPLSSCYIDKVLIGVDSVSQLKLNLQEINNKDFYSTFFPLIDNIEVENKELLNPAKWKIQ